MDWHAEHGLVVPDMFKNRLMMVGEKGSFGWKIEHKTKQECFPVLYCATSGSVSLINLFPASIIVFSIH